jgi:starvation-inducible outer membrane lipoprotein
MALHRILGFWLLTFLVVIASLMLSGCVSSPSQSPLGEMFAAHSRGEIACVRNGVLVRGRENCK